MANWRYTLNVKNEWQATKAGDMTLQAFAAFAASQVRVLPPFEKDVVLFDIATELESIADDEIANTDWFDSVWSQLYDWADQRVGGWNDKMCWIKTF
jgi:hypothetical protein